MSDEKLPEQPKEEIRISTTKIIEMAQMVLATNASPGEIKKATGLSYYQISKIRSMDEYHRTLEELRGNVLQHAKATTISQIAQLLPLALEALKNNLKDNNMDAVKTAFRAIGIEEKEGDTKDGTIQIVLPGQQVEKSIDIESKEV